MFKGSVCFVAAGCIVHLLCFWLKLILPIGWFDVGEKNQQDKSFAALMIIVALG